jgi:monofunctional chorismate mutase
MRIKGIRGAITVRENCEKEIIAKTKELLSAIMEANDLTIDRIIRITFTATKDLDAVYPAVAARELGMTEVPLMCCQEMYVEGSLNRCIRVLVYIYQEAEKKPRHIYLEEAASLRPDLVKT